MLLKAGADPQAKDNYEYTVEDHAKLSKDPEIISLFK
jgi:hypothetical protein